ncbi:ComF family protein [Amycolatopsis sp. NPDC059657]|uniref:ComF family protein n=1 Tax=Amycolatopsis sp. NPDC059657 TaxID=3346899 RepID=UPI00367108DE
MKTRAFDLLVPTRCAGCGAVGEPCCVNCAAVWDSLTEVARGPTAGLVPVYALAAYRGVARRLVLAYKERGRRDLAPALGAALAGAVPSMPNLAGEAVWLVPVPSKASVSRMRGGAHMARLARWCARALGDGAAVAPALRLDPRVRDAVGLGGRERAANLAGKVRLRERGLAPRGSRVILLDDVITSGSTAAACVRVLALGGMHVAAVLTLTAAG